MIAVLETRAVHCALGLSSWLMTEPSPRQIAHPFQRLLLLVCFGPGHVKAWLLRTVPEIRPCSRPLIGITGQTSISPPLCIGLVVKTPRPLRLVILTIRLML